MDKLKVLHKLAANPALSAKIFKAVADPPTTSLQRLKVEKLSIRGWGTPYFAHFVILY